MSGLVKNLFDRRYDDLVRMGRSRLPGLAPEWTDYNAHDPGITLMELLAWVAEAQLYSLSRTRRDERAAYAAMLDMRGGGTRAAEGLIWPDPLDPSSPAVTYARSVIIERDAAVHALNTETLTFRTTHKVLWVPARITRLQTRLADGSVVDHTRINERGGPAFLPFGEAGGPGDVLTMDLETRGDGGLFPPRKENAKDAHLVIGIRAEAVSPEGPKESAGDAEQRKSQHAHCAPPLAATLVHAAGRYPLAIVHDSSDGLLRTGALVLDVSRVTGSPTTFSIELRSSLGFERAPRVLRIEANVLPIAQRQSIERESHTASGQPDFNFQLDVPGLCFAADEKPVHVEVGDAADFRAWTRCERLSEQGPNDAVFELDEATSRVTFGNGHNGRMPAQGAQIFVSYAVSEGEEGNTARNRKWRVEGFSGTFGVNPDAIGGGLGRLDSRAQRRQARRRAREDHALVSAEDLVAAAKSLPLLEVARAWVLSPEREGARHGTITLIAMRQRPGGKEPRGIPETARWLRGIERRLSGRVPLGTRLVVMRPRYVEFFVHATLQAEQGRDPDVVSAKVREALSEKLALVPTRSGAKPRPAGVPLARRDVAAWMRSVDGVQQVTKIEIVRAGGKAEDDLPVPPNGLPRIDLDRSEIVVNRSGRSVRRDG